MSRLPPQRSKNLPPHSSFSTSDGQKFLSFLNGLGYVSTSKETEKPEYFEYLFQNNDNPLRVDTIRELMKKLSSKNVLDAAEVETFEQQKAEGHVLYGKDLEEAVDRRSALDQRWTDSNAQLTMEKDTIRQLIAKKKREMELLKTTRNSIRSFEDQLPDESALKSKLERESKELGVALEVSKLRLDKKMSTIPGNETSAFSPSHQDSDPEMWQSLFQREEKLYGSTKRLIEENIAHLISQADELDSNDQYQQQLSKEFLSVINEYAENLERLKHSIVYENVREAESKWTFDYLEDEDSQIRTCLAEFIHMFQKKSGFNMENHWAQNDSALEQADTVKAELDAKKQDYLNQVRNDSRIRINKELQVLVNIQAPARDRLFNFFSNIYSIIEPQKIRMDLVCNIVAIAKNQELDRQNMLTEFTSRSKNLQKKLDVLTQGLNEQYLNRNGQMLLYLANQRGITNIDLRLVSSSSRALQTVAYESNYRSWEGLMQSVDEMRNPSLKQMNRKYSHLLEKHSSVYLPAVEKHAKELEKLSALEKKLNEDENAFKAMQDSKQSIIAESIAKKKLLLELMEQVLNDKGEQCTGQLLQ